MKLDHVNRAASVNRIVFDDGNKAKRTSEVLRDGSSDVDDDIGDRDNLDSYAGEVAKRLEVTPAMSRQKRVSWDSPAHNEAMRRGCPARRSDQALQPSQEHVRNTLDGAVAVLHRSYDGWRPHLWFRARVPGASPRRRTSSHSSTPAPPWLLPALSPSRTVRARRRAKRSTTPWPV